MTRPDENHFRAVEHFSAVQEALARTQETADRVRRQTAEVKFTARDKDRLLSATVGGRGELREVTFHGDEYRELAPAELGALLVKTIEQARAGARQRAMASIGDLVADLPRLRATAQGASSFEDLLEGLVGLVTRPGPADDAARTEGRLP